MNNTQDSFKKGDKCFIFAKFPIDPTLFSKFPITIYPGVHFIDTPQHAFRNAGGRYVSKEENIALAEWVCPGFFLKFGMCDVCVKVDSTINEDRMSRMFWAAIASLLILKPLHISVSGAFIYGDKENGYLGRMPEKLDYRTNISLSWLKENINSMNLLNYNLSDFETSKKIFPIILNILDSEKSNPRVFFNLRSFLLGVIWEKFIYQGSLYSKLFPLIDSFAGNPAGVHAEKVSLRIGKFLSNCPTYNTSHILTEEAIINRLKYIWELHRYPELHGHIKEPLPARPTEESLNADFSSEEGVNDLYDLFEMSRLALLKMILMDSEDYQAYSKIPIPLTGVALKEAKSSNNDRDSRAKSFFSKIYKNSEVLIAYSMLKTI